MAETALQMPLLTWKYCIQEGRAYPKSLKGWYRGVFVQAGSVAPITGLQVVLNGVFERLFTGGVRDLTQFEGLQTALLAGIASSLIYGPADLLVIQQQKLKLGAGETLKACTANYGTRSLFRGLSATAVREGIYTGGVLGLAPIFFTEVKKQFGLSDLPCYIVSGIGA